MNELGLDSVNPGLAASEQVGSPPPPRSLRNLLDGEMEHSAALRQEVDTLKRKVAEQEERHVTKVQALAWLGAAGLGEALASPQAHFASVLTNLK